MKYSRSYKDEIAGTIFMWCQKRMKYVEYLFDHTTKSTSTVINMIDFDIKSRFGQVDIVYIAYCIYSL